MKVILITILIAQLTSTSQAEIYCNMARRGEIKNINEMTQIIGQAPSKKVTTPNGKKLAIWVGTRSTSTQTPEVVTQYNNESGEIIKEGIFCNRGIINIVN